MDDNFDHDELKEWPVAAKDMRDNFCESFTGFVPIDFGKLCGFTNRTGSKKYLVVHPLWDVRNSTNLLAKAKARAGGEFDGYLDTFNLLRRPAQCKAWLEQEVNTNGTE